MTIYLFLVRNLDSTAFLDRLLSVLLVLGLSLPGTQMIQFCVSLLPWVWHVEAEWRSNLRASAYQRESATVTISNARLIS